MLYLPNLLSLARLAMVPWLMILLNQQEYVWSLVVFLLAGASDAIDGFIAKHFNAETELGAILDPLADKALLVSCYIMLSVSGYVPFWLMVVVVFRDAVIVGGYIVMVLSFGSVKMHPLIISKANTVSQISYVVMLLVALSWSINLEFVLMILSIVVLFTSVVSGTMYVYIWSLKATNSSDNKFDRGSENQNNKNIE